MLTNRSQRTRVNSAIRLFPHQEAVVSKMTEMELTHLKESFETNNSTPCVGLLADPPGSGKSYCVLGTILKEKEVTNAKWSNLLIVPYSIYNQWKEYIHNFHPSLSMYELNNYHSIISVSEINLDYYDIVITTTMFYPTIDDTMRGLGKIFHRIIIDEFDSVSFFMQEIIPCENLWLISASIDLTKTKIFKNIVCDNDKIVRCDPTFIKSSIALPEMNEKTCVCNNKYVDLIRYCVDHRIYPDTWDSKWYKKCFSGDSASFKHTHIAGDSIEESHRRFLKYLRSELIEMHDSSAESERQLREKLLIANSRQNDLAQRRRELLLSSYNISNTSTTTQLPTSSPQQSGSKKSVRKTTRSAAPPSTTSNNTTQQQHQQPASADVFTALLFSKNNDIMNKPLTRDISYDKINQEMTIESEQIASLKHQIDELTMLATSKELCYICFSDDVRYECDDGKFVCERCEHNDLKKVAPKIKDKNNEDKDDQLRRIMTNELARPNSKVLICSDFSGSFTTIREILDSMSIKYVEIDGTVEEIEKNVTEFQNGTEKNVMFINVRQYGAGFNLEMSSSLILMHKTNRLQQVLGRAQRFGRTVPLNVYYLYYNCELDID